MSVPSKVPTLASMQVPTSPVGKVGKDLRVLIVGAGPVGMALAALLVSDPHFNAEVTIRELERRMGRDNDSGVLTWKNLADGNRRREQVVTIQDSVCALLPKDVADAFRSHCRVWPTSSNIPLKQIEDDLLRLLQTTKYKGRVQFHLVKSGRELVNKNTVSHMTYEEKEKEYVRANGDDIKTHIRKMKDKNQEYDLVVGCDGAGSGLRQAYGVEFDPAGSDWAAGVVVNQDSFGYTGLKGYHTSLFPKIGLEQFHAIQTISQTRYLLNADYKDSIRGYLNIRLSEEEFKELKALGEHYRLACNFTEPATPSFIFRRDEMENGWVYFPPHLRERLYSAFQFYGLSTVTIGPVATFQLQPGAVKKFFWSDQNVKEGVYLCGDAAISHHFWPGRGLNTGLKSVSALVSALSMSTKPWEQYEKSMSALKQREIVDRSKPICMIPHVSQPVVVTLAMEEKAVQDYANRLSKTFEIFKNAPTWPALRQLLTAGEEKAKDTPVLQTAALESFFREKVQSKAHMLTVAASAPWPPQTRIKDMFPAVRPCLKQQLTKDFGGDLAFADDDDQKHEANPSGPLLCTNCYFCSPSSIDDDQKHEANPQDDDQKHEANPQGSSVAIKPPSTAPRVIEAASSVECWGVRKTNSREPYQYLGHIKAKGWAIYPGKIIAGKYRVQYRVASVSGGGQIKLEKAGGDPFYGIINVDRTGGWHTWSDISHDVSIDKDIEKLAVSFPAVGFNLKSITLTAA